MEFLIGLAVGTLFSKQIKIVVKDFLGMFLEKKENIQK